MTTTPYADLDVMPLAGAWRPGASQGRFVDTDPYTGEVVLEGRRASVADVDDAYAGAALAQRDWARTSPAERSAVFLRSAEVIDARTEELVDWLTREAGTTRMRAYVEIGIVRATAMAAVTHTALGWQTVASDVPGKESRIYNGRSASSASSARGTCRCTCPTARWPRRWRSATASSSSRPATPR